MPGPRVVVAMSGGVDSSAAAALLCAQGFEVVGVTLKLYDASGTPASAGGRCCSPRDIADARRVADRLGFPHYVLDEVEAFRGAVVEDFLDAYRRGQTPNPCVRCNERIKFGPLLAFARQVGADRLATGHYARLRAGPDGVQLLRGRDADKDQAYFLFAVRRDWLARVSFPVGELRKDEVRALARQAGLDTADKPDSTELCFVPGGDHQAFVSRHGGGRAGVILDEQGSVLGHHAGTHLYTLGQRRGVPARDGQARFVTRIDADSGTVLTGPRERLRRAAIRVEDVRWLADAGDGLDARPVSVQLRHRGRAHGARLLPLGGAADAARAAVEVRFDEPTEAAAPGQAAVFFDGDVVLGGGWVAADEQGERDSRADQWFPCGGTAAPLPPIR